MPAMNLDMIINGENVAGAEQIEVVDPSTEQTYQKVSRGNAAHVQQAVAAAKAAFFRWSHTDISLRQKALRAIGQSIHDNKQQLAEILSREVGRPLAHSVMEVNVACAVIEHAATQSLPVETLKQNARGRLQLHRRPLGVVVGIVPWNMPFIQAASKLAPAVLMGNTVVLKPSPSAPVALLTLAKLVQPHLPPGVVNMISDNNDLGELLCTHPDVAKISFTGSTATGYKVAQAAGASLKRLTLELGGSDAAIVTEKSNLKYAVHSLMGLAMYNCGQVCTAAKRIYVHSSIYDDFCDAASEIAKAHKPGSGFDPSSTIGPLQNAQQYQKAQAYLEEAKTCGRIIAGGACISGKGYFIEPTVVTDLADDTKLVTQEQFCPIIPILKYQDETEVIRRANNSPYGLGGSVWSQDAEHARQLALQLDCGQIWVNQHSAGDLEAPSLGAKQSGLGAVLGEEGLKAQTQLQVLNERFTERA